MKLLPLILNLALMSSSMTYADVRFDDSLNSANSGVTLSGEKVEIDASRGIQKGGNLFHSFDQFGVRENQTVNFSSASTSQPITNIFSRVTGNEISHVDGVLRSTIPNADLYLFNPNGVVFGEHGKLNLQGSLHISTANQIRFEDNHVFDSKPTSNELLTSAAPAAFGFLDKPADISVNTASLGNDGDPELHLRTGKAIDFTGGNLTFTNPNITIYNGTIRLVSSKIAGEIPVSTNEMVNLSPKNGGEIHLTNSTFATWSVPRNALPSGEIIIQGGRLVMDSAAITSSSFSEKSGGDIHISVDEMRLSKLPEFNGKEPELKYVSKIQNNAYDKGNGGNTFIKSNLLDLKDASVISAEATKRNQNSTGNGGSLTIESPIIKLANHSKISASSNTNLGNAGKIDITTNALNVENSAISVETTQSNAGDININATNLIYFLNSELTTSAASGKGNGGNIDINRPVFTVLNDSKIIANASKGNGGNITIASNYLLQSTDSVIKASSDFGLQGSISINSANSNIAGSIAVLSNRFMDSSNLMHEGCNHYRKNSSSFIVSSPSLVTTSPDNTESYIPVSLQDCSLISSKQE